VNVARARLVKYPNGNGAQLWFWCRGCDTHHAVTVPPTPHAWKWNERVDLPTIQPSILVNRGSAHPGVPVCHSYVTDGRIQYLSGCTHALAGQTVDLDPIADSMGQEEDTQQ
jgi:hypothetical protein